MRRVLSTYEKVIWLNPTPPQQWRWTSSINFVQKLVSGHMYPLTLHGLEEGMAYLSK
jgi:uncharacterized protein with von Willebrand factor type A (vWA) domain